MASGGGARHHSSLPALSSAPPAETASRLSSLPCARYEHRLKSTRINVKGGHGGMLLSDHVRSSDPLSRGIGEGCSDPLLLNYDPFRCPLCQTQGEAAKGKTLGMLNCGCIVCDVCLEKPFSSYKKQMNGQCPMCGATVFKDQSRIKIGGMMLCNKRHKALDEWCDPHVRSEQQKREAVFEHLDDVTFREMLMPLHTATAARAGADEPLAFLMRQRDVEITRLKRRIDALERGVREGNAEAKEEQARLQVDLKRVMKQKGKDKADLELELKKWEDFREKREEIVLDKLSNDRMLKDKAELLLRDYQRMKEEHVKYKIRLESRAALDGAGPADASAADGDGAQVVAARAGQDYKMPNAHKADKNKAQATAAEKLAGGYSDSVALARARRECWLGHGFKAASSSSSSTVGSTVTSGAVKQQQQKQQLL